MCVRARGVWCLYGVCVSSREDRAGRRFPSGRKRRRPPAPRSVSAAFPCSAVSPGGCPRLSSRFSRRATKPPRFCTPGHGDTPQIHPARPAAIVGAAQECARLSPGRLCWVSRSVSAGRAGARLAPQGAGGLGTQGSHSRQDQPAPCPSPASGAWKIFAFQGNLVVFDVLFDCLGIDRAPILWPLPRRLQWPRRTPAAVLPHASCAVLREPWGQAARAELDRRR